MFLEPVGQQLIVYGVCSSSPWNCLVHDGEMYPWAESSASPSPSVAISSA